MQNPQEANNSESIHTVQDDVVYFSSELNCVEFEYAVHVDKVELACTTHVKGRLKERIAFWQSIGASRWVLEVLKDGYCLPFISLPQKAFFRNHCSVVEDEEFVCQEVSKLLSSGAIAEVERDERNGVQPFRCCKELCTQASTDCGLALCKQTLAVM